MSRNVEPPADDWLTAVHEAGHAVERLVRGLPVGLVAITDDSDAAAALGFCAVSADYIGTVAYLTGRGLEPPVAPPSALIEHLLMLLAGPIAESVARAVPYSAASTGGFEDRYQAEWLVGGALHRAPYSAGVRDFLAVIEVVAAADVCKNWTWIETVARQLVTARRLTGDEVGALRPGVGK